MKSIDRMKRMRTGKNRRGAGLRILAVFLAALLFMLPAGSGTVRAGSIPVKAAGETDPDSLLRAAADGLRAWTGHEGNAMLTEEKFFSPGSSESDWIALVFALAGEEDDYGGYLRGLLTYVEEKYRSAGGLDRVKATEYQRVALTVTALGGDPRAFGTKENGEAIDLIADGSYAFAGNALDMQGSNALIYALLMLDAKDVAIPADSAVTRETILSSLLEYQEEDGGFSLAKGSGSGADLTGMALQAISPYRGEPAVADAAERAVAYLADSMTDRFTYLDNDAESAESLAQAVIGLCACGIDPETDPAFSGNGRSLLSALGEFRLPDGTYMHNSDDPATNLIATEQVMMAYLAVKKLREEGSSLMDLGAFTPPSAGWTAEGNAEAGTAGSGEEDTKSGAAEEPAGNEQDAAESRDTGNGGPAAGNGTKGGTGAKAAGIAAAVILLAAAGILISRKRKGKEE